MKENKTLKALWVGGPPGSTIKNISQNLRREGIDIVEQWVDESEAKEKHRIPSMIEVILFNHEMGAHNIQDKIKALAKKANKPFVLASLSTRKTVIELRAKGVLKEYTTPIKVIEKTEEDKTDETLKAVMALITEREVLRKQSQGIRNRLIEIEQRLTNIRNNVYTEE